MFRLSSHLRPSSRQGFARGARLLSEESSTAKSADKVAARLERRKALESKSQSSSAQFRLPIFSLAITAALSGCAYAIYDVRNNENGSLRAMYNGSYLESVVKYFMDPVKDIFLPSKDKLMPDWPDDPVYSNANIAPGTPAPPLLVLDVEKTLVGSEYDPKNGWRFVKRPGVDELIEALHQYYEIVLFSERDFGLVEPILMALDKNQRCTTYLTSNHAQQTKDNKFLKRLDLMNRDLRRIILIDDDPDAFEGFESNTLQVQPFENIRDKQDTVLLDLIPLLQALVHEDSKDFRKTLESLGTRYAEEAAVEYQLRVAKAREEEKRRRNVGLGGLIRGRTRPEVIDEQATVRSLIPSPSALVGGSSSSSSTDGSSSSASSSSSSGATLPKADAPAVVKKKGALFDWLEKAEKEKEELERLKGEKMNQIYLKRMEEKKKAEKKAMDAAANTL